MLSVTRSTESYAQSSTSSPQERRMIGRSLRPIAKSEDFALCSIISSCCCAIILIVVGGTLWGIASSRGMLIAGQVLTSVGLTACSTCCIGTFVAAKKLGASSGPV